MSRFRAKAAIGLLPELLFAASVVLIFSKPLFTHEAFTGRDIVPYALPVEGEIHAAYRRGAMPVWTSNISGGRPLAANPNNGAFYPIRPLLSLVSFPAAARLFPLIHWIGAGLGVMFLLRAIGAPAGGALVAAFAYTFSGVGVSEVFFSSYHPGMALLPWTLWAVARPVPSRRARILPLALVLGLMMLAGDVFTTTVAIAASLLWIVVEEESGRRWSEVTSLAAAAGLGMLLGAPQILAAALWAPHTERAVVGIPLGVATVLSLPVWRLLELIVPYPYGPIWALERGAWFQFGPRFFFASLFCGALGVLAIPLLLRRRPRGSLFAILLGAGAAVASVLPSFVPAAWAAWRSPIPLRFPEKFSVAIVLAVAIAAGLGVRLWREGERVTRWALAITAAITAVAVVAWAWPNAAAAAAAPFVPGQVLPGAGQEIAAAFAEGGLLWAATLVALDLLPRPGRWVPAAAILLLAGVPVLANRRVAHTESESSVFRPPPFVVLANRRDPAGRFRLLDESWYRTRSPLGDPQAPDPNGTAYYRANARLYTTSLWHRGTVLNSNPDLGDLVRLDSLRTLSSIFPSVPNGNALFSGLSLRFGIRWRDQDPLPGFRPISGNAVQVWDENLSALPPVRVPSRVVETVSSVDALRAFPALGPGEIVVESGRAGDSTPSGARITALDDAPERLRFTVETAASAWVFVLRGYWPYRTVRVDGELVDSMPAQLAFSAIPVPAGRHVVDWKEELPGAAVSWWGPVGFLVAALVIGRRRSPQSAAAP